MSTGVQQNIVSLSSLRANTLRRRSNANSPSQFDTNSFPVASLFTKQHTKKQRCSLRRLSLASLPFQDQISPLKYISIWQRCVFKIKIIIFFTRNFIKKETKKTLPKIPIQNIDSFDQSFSNGKNRKSTSLTFSECCEKVELLKKASNLFAPNSETINNESVPFLIIHPNSRFKHNWNMILLLLLLYTAIGTPFILAFGDNFDQELIFFIEVSVSGLFFVDFFINCSTGYTENQVLVTSRSKILLNYLKGWMLLDFISWFPFDFFLGTSGNPSKDFARLSRLPKLNRLLRVSRLVHLLNSSIRHEVLEKFQEFLNIKSSKLRLLKTIASVVICTHIVSCFWYLSAKMYDFSPNTWVVKGNYQDSDLFSLYITCMYWAVTTLSTCGYGDIVPNTELEICLATGWMATGLYFFSFTISSLNSMIGSYDLKENVLSAKLAAIDEFASENNLNPSLRNKLKHSLRYASEKRGFSWNEKIDLINELPKQLRYEVAVNMYQGAARQLKFFYSQDQSIVALIVPYLDPIFIEKDCFVYEEHDFADEIYFLVRGDVVISSGVKVKVDSVKNGDYFGDVEVLLEYSRRFSAYTSRHSDILIMNRIVINKIKDFFFGVWCKMMDTARERQAKYERNLIEIKELGKELKNSGIFYNMSGVRERIDRNLQNKMRSLEKVEVLSYGTVVEKLNELLEIAALKRLGNFDFVNEYLLYIYYL